MDTDVYESNFCPSATLAANNTFPDPTGPTYFRIVNDIHVLGFLVPVVFYHWSPHSLAWVGFHLLTVLSIVLVFGGDDWSRTSSAFRAADLQSTGVTNFPTHP